MSRRYDRLGYASRIPLGLGLVALLAGAWPLGAQAQDQDLPEAWRPLVAEYADRIRSDVETDEVGSIATAVVVHGEIVWSEAFGWADRDARTPATPEHLYRTGSISKSVTAVLAMLLVEDGVIRWEDPVGQHLPETAGFTGARPGQGEVTLRQLGSHTSGLMREPRLEGAASGPIEGWEDKVLASIPRTAFDTVPGARYAYSNIGYGVLGLAISRAAGRPFMDLVETRIFQPLGMTSSTFVVDSGLEERLAAGYTLRRDGSVDGEQPAREHAGRGYKVPNGGVYSTVADLGRFMGAVSGGLPLLRPESRTEMLTVQTPEDPDSGYGLGFSLSTDEAGRTLAGHGGSVAGYNAYMLFEPESGVGVVLLRNYSGGTTNLGQAARELLVSLLNAADAPHSSEGW